MCRRNLSSTIEMVQHSTLAICWYQPLNLRASQYGFWRKDMQSSECSTWSDDVDIFCQDSQAFQAQAFRQAQLGLSKLFSNPSLPSSSFANSEPKAWKWAWKTWTWCISRFHCVRPLWFFVVYHFFYTTKTVKRYFFVKNWSHFLLFTPFTPQFISIT